MTGYKTPVWPSVLIGISVAALGIGLVFDYWATRHAGSPIGYLVVFVSMPGWVLGTILSGIAGRNSGSLLAWIVCVANILALANLYLFPGHVS